jgi:hypothetical protein
MLDFRYVVFLLISNLCTQQDVPDFNVRSGTAKCSPTEDTVLTQKRMAVNTVIQETDKVQRRRPRHQKRQKVDTHHKRTI